MRQGPQGPACVASEKSDLFSSCEGHVRIPLDSLPANRAVSRVQLGISVFLSSSDRDLGLFIKVQRGRQALSGVEAWNSVFLSSCPRGVRAPVEFRQGIWAFSRGSAGETGLQSCFEGYLGFHWSQCRGIWTYLELRGHSVSFFLEAGSMWFHSRFNR